jgi:ribosomal protein S18 acetylase RimI-like enzyme
VPALRAAGLEPTDRGRVAEILRSTQLFRDDEVDVALELFDEGAVAPNTDYSLLGLFDDARSDGGAGALVGFACYGPTPDTDRTYDLYWIAVHAEAQGAGAGTVLLNEVERRLRDDDARLLVIETSSRADYAATRGFYARRGYVEAARVGHFYAPDDDRIIFTKRFVRPREGAGVVS